MRANPWGDALWPPTIIELDSRQMPAIELAVHNIALE
jgi:hypothetical protein